LQNQSHVKTSSSRLLNLNAQSTETSVGCTYSAKACNCTGVKGSSRILGKAEIIEVVVEGESWKVPPSEILKRA